jgi:hypothetical protein
MNFFSFFFLTAVTTTAVTYAAVVRYTGDVIRVEKIRANVYRTLGVHLWISYLHFASIKRYLVEICIGSREGRLINFRK